MHSHHKTGRTVVNVNRLSSAKLDEFFALARELNVSNSTSPQLATLMQSSNITDADLALNILRHCSDWVALPLTQGKTDNVPDSYLAVHPETHRKGDGSVSGTHALWMGLEQTK